MALMVAFLLISAVGGQFIRSLDWKLYIFLLAAAGILGLIYYVDRGVW
jgi:hypothetical protein